MAEEYISKNEILDHIKDVYEQAFISLEARQMVSAFKAYVSNLPTADVVEVVRCEKCKYRNFNPESLQTKCMRRPYAPIYVEPNDFCSCGERNDI